MNRSRCRMPYSKLIKEAHDDLTEMMEAAEKHDMEFTYEDWEEVELLCDVCKKLDETFEIVKKHVTTAISGHHNPRGRGRA